MQPRLAPARLVFRGGVSVVGLPLLQVLVEVRAADVGVWVVHEQVVHHRSQWIDLFSVVRGRLQNGRRRYQPFAVVADSALYQPCRDSLRFAAKLVVKTAVFLALE